MKKNFLYFLMLITLIITSFKAQAQTCAGNISIPATGSCTVGSTTSNFYDSGGSAANYGASETRTYTICPLTAGQKVKVVFTAFSTESGYDGLTIYNGNSTASPIISSGLAAGTNATTAPAGSFYGTTSPGTKFSSDATGCLTFKFTSDSGTQSTGWTATVQEALPSTISAITSANAAGCNNNATATNPADDYFTADITVTFANKPATGNLVLSGTGLHSTNTVTTVAVGSTSTATTHTFVGVRIKAINSTQSITATFTLDGTTLTNNAIPVLSGCGVPQGVTSCASPTKLCTQVGQTLSFATDVTGANASVTNPGNTYGCLSSSPRPSWYYIELATNGSIDITLQGYDSASGTVDNDFALWGPFASAAAAQAACNSYGTPIDCSFSSGSGSEIINIPVTGTAGQVYVLLVTGYSSTSAYFTMVQQGSSTGATECGGVAGVCDMSNLTVTAGACSDNGTNSNSADDYYTADVTVTFANKPTTGNLVLSGTGLHTSNSVTTVAVASTTTSTTHTYTGVRIKANGSATSLTATFSANTGCNFTKSTITAVASCSVPPCNASSTMTWN